MKTQGLIQALDSNGFDAAFGGPGEMKKSRAMSECFLFVTVLTLGSEEPATGIVEPI